MAVLPERMKLLEQPRSCVKHPQSIRSANTNVLSQTSAARSATATRHKEVLSFADYAVIEALTETPELKARAAIAICGS